MEIKDYLEKMEEVNTTFYTPKKDLRMKLQLIAPLKRKESFDFILILGGSYFTKIKCIEGIYINEFMKVLNKGLYPIQDKKNTSYILDEAIRNISKLIPNTSSEVIIEVINRCFDEIRRYMNGEILTKVFKRWPEYLFSYSYHRPTKVCVMADNKISTIQEMHEVLSSLEYQKVSTIVYPSILSEDNNAASYLSDKKCFYNILDSDGKMPLAGLLRLKEAGLDEIRIPMNSLDASIELKMSSLNTKDILSLIKLSMQAGLKISLKTRITKDNIAYLDFMKLMHQKGIRSFQIEMDNELKDKDILLKQIYYYANMYSLELKLLSKGILKEKDISKMNIIPVYREYMVSSYYTYGDFSLYADKNLKNRLGSLSMDKIENVFTSSIAKKLRKKSLKRK